MRNLGITSSSLDIEDCRLRCVKFKELYEWAGYRLSNIRHNICYLLLFSEFFVTHIQTGLHTLIALIIDGRFFFLLFFKFRERLPNCALDTTIEATGQGLDFFSFLLKQKKNSQGYLKKKCEENKHKQQGQLGTRDHN